MMQTFIPCRTYVESASVLDWRRLGKQRLEALQIYLIISGIAPKSRWRNHPAVRMWRGYTDHLAAYYNTILSEWIRRGFNNTMQFLSCDIIGVPKPAWLTDEFMAAHRAALLAKDWGYYRQFSWVEEPKIAYIWPV